jgi:formylglycine-generating enzyme required for sulfatase activity
VSEPIPLKYRAFISYSHADTDWAKWLHRALESFPIGKDLAGRFTESGEIPKALRPVFRDRDEFTAGQALSEQTLAALDASRALIVICSPDAANSRYVNEETRLFKSRHAQRPVIPLIVGGKPGDPELECFPPALKFKVDAKGRTTKKRVEMLAADARENGDGKDLVLAKVVAGLLGLSSDDVFRRAERERLAAARRRRRIQALFGALALVLVMGSIGWMNQGTIREQYHWRLAMKPKMLTAGLELGLKPGDEFTECQSGCPTMVVVPAGRFTMGGETKYAMLQREVTLAKPFAIGKYEVTFQEWDACVEAGGCPSLSDEGWGRGTMPAINVSWHDAKRYVAWLAKLTGKPYRLLSEAEWEYAARGGTATIYPFGDDKAELGEYAWYQENSGTTTVHQFKHASMKETTGQRAHPAGEKRPNGFGLYDMIGNVFEWVEDQWHDGYDGAPTDGSVWIDTRDPRDVAPGCGMLDVGQEVPPDRCFSPVDPQSHALRGGSWDLADFYLYVAGRIKATSASRGNNIGFRVARDLNR